MSSIGAVVTTFDRPAAIVRRAVQSVEAQTRRTDGFAVCDDSAIPDNPYLSWCGAVSKLGTDYVAILHDDDWYEPTFIERAENLLDAGAGYVISEATIHFPDGTTRLNLMPGLTEFPGDFILPRESAEEMLLNTPLAISPSCCMFRREDVLWSLLPGGIPGKRMDVFAGPDMLLTLLPLLWRDKIGIIPEPLCNFSAGDDSITIKNLNDGVLQRQYDDAKALYRGVRDALHFR